MRRPRPLLPSFLFIELALGRLGRLFRLVPSLAAAAATAFWEFSASCREHKDHKEEEKDEEKGGFIEKVKDFIHDIGEKIEGAIGFGKPTADVSGIHIPSINLKQVELVVDVLVTNPNPIPIPLIDINYLVESDGRKLVSGLIPDAGTIHAHGSETVKIPVKLIYDDIKSTYNDIKPGSIIPYKIKVDLIVDVPIFGRLTLPLEKNGEIPVPYKPDVDVEKIRFEKFSFEETTAVLHLKLENKNDFDLALKALDYEIWLADVSIGGAELKESTKIDKNGISFMKIPISFRPKDFGSALWDMIRGRGTGYTMKGNIDAETPFGPMKLPISKEGGTTRLKKNKDGDEDSDEKSGHNLCLQRLGASTSLTCSPALEENVCGDSYLWSMRI
ncbi:hypothetical protein Taro_054962 [Colocasia esculenta]|uniref:Water stress and hypersensitive response domain-containing protein n=1 Tax=Colocasia esculenta TaxID=4460 RepID=A0A843XSS2_COLES|nr:hypothetical protein [Colocasia esculenta]